MRRYGEEVVDLGHEGLVVDDIGAAVECPFDESGDAQGGGDGGDGDGEELLKGFFVNFEVGKEFVCPAWW